MQGQGEGVLNNSNFGAFGGAHGLSYIWGGRGLRSAIYRNLVSVMHLFKNFIFPLRKILSLPSLLLGTLYVYVFSFVLHVIYVAGRFSVFVFPKCHRQ